jgi:hypothetical protein
MDIQNSGAEAAKMKSTQKNRIITSGMLFHNMLRRGIAHGRNRYSRLKNRYGSVYPIAILGVALLTYPVPIPGITMSSVAFVVLIAEAHRTIFLKRRPSGDYCQSGGCGED